MSEVETQPNCTTCGLPLAGLTCRACGGSGHPIPMADGDAASTSAYAPEAPSADLELAQAAWENGDYGKLVSHCLAAIEVTDATMQQGAHGPTFKAPVRGLGVFIRVSSANGAVVIETPAVRLPLTQYIPSLRLLLEMSDRDATPIRFGVRGDLVMARYVGRLGAMTPSNICSTIQLVVTQALECARLLVGALQANPFTAAEHAALKIDALPRGVTLSEELPVSIPQSPKKGSGLHEAVSPPPPKVSPMPAPSPAARPTPVAQIPAILMPPGGMPAALQSRAKAPTPARMMDRKTPIAEVRASSIPRAPAPAPMETVRTPTAPPPKPQPAPRVGLAPKPAQKPTTPGVPAAMRTMVSADTQPQTAPSPVADPLGDTFIAHKNAGPQKTGDPTDPFVELLHKAQTLGAVLSFADQPATMCLLIRATVYRSIFEHESVAPAAVAQLFHATQPMTKEIYITAPGVRRGSMAIPPTSPAFEVMAKLVAQQGRSDFGEALAIQPITTAQEAKQHLARYVSEIDQAPSDLELRHFLALGALTELLSRTKLPPATQERLKGIVSHARKEGAKQQIVELMMTALTRMIA